MTNADAQTHPTLSEEVPERWEIADQWQRAWRAMRWSVAGVFAFGALFAIGQLYLFFNLFSDIHPALGWLMLASVAGLGVWLVGLPLYRFLKAPEIAEAPDVDLTSPHLSLAELGKRIDYDDAYLKGMAGNPALGDKRSDAAKAREDLRSIIGAGAPETLADQAKALARFEKERIASLLKGLDTEVDEYIRKEALAVGGATAVSLNGSIDAFIVLWRNVNMISRISRLYYGRPSLRLSLIIIRDVILAVILSRVLEDVTEAAGEALGGLVTKLGGMVVGPVLDGSVNALMTLKLGYLAKKRCRSFDVWSEATAYTATVEVFDRVKQESTGLIGELFKVGGGVASAAASAADMILAAPKSAWSLVQNTFVRKTADKTDTHAE